MIFSNPPENFNPLFDVVGCAIEYDDKILLLHRQSHKNQPNTRQLPSGKVESEESNTEAMIREIHEETQIEIQEKELTYIQSVYARHGNYDLNYHMFKIILNHKPTITINPEEHQGYQWLTPNQAINLPDGIEDLDSCTRLIYQVDVPRCRQ